MLNGIQERMLLVGAPEITPAGDAQASPIGQVRCALLHRSGEERTDAELDRAAETVYAVIPARDAPPGGFERGMAILDGRGQRYRMLLPVRCGGVWSVKCVRCVR